MRVKSKRISAKITRTGVYSWPHVRVKINPSRVSSLAARLLPFSLKHETGGAAVCSFWDVWDAPQTDDNRETTAFNWSLSTFALDVSPRSSEERGSVSDCGRSTWLQLAPSAHAVPSS